MFRNTLPPRFFLLILLLGGRLPSSAAQETTTSPDRIAPEDPAAELWYPYNGAISWAIGPDGAPVPQGSPSPSPPGAPATGETPPRRTWRPPVVPAESLPGTAHLAGPGDHVGAPPFTAPPQEALEDLQAVDADASATAPTPEPVYRDLPLPPPEPWTDTVKKSFSSGTQNVVGAFNWVRLESKELVDKTMKPFDRFANKCATGRRRLLIRRREQ
jgi:hypothetical protein